MVGVDYPIWALPRADGLLIGGSSSIPTATYACLLAVNGSLA
jgi:hypothetical protein